MSYSMSMNMQNKQTQSLKQAQRLIMSPQMQQAIHMLQMPVMEIAAAIDAEMQQNPVLEYSEPVDDGSEQYEAHEEMPAQAPEVDFDGKDFEILKHLSEEYDAHFAESGNHYSRRSQEEDKLKTFQETNIVQQASLYRHLMDQAEHTFDSGIERRMAEALIGSLDESGFLSGPLEEIAALNGFSLEELRETLQEIQRFDPLGVGAQNLRESLLIQLRGQRKQNALCYKIVENHYDDLLHNRIPLICRSLNVSAEEVRTAVDADIIPLDLNPGGSCAERPVHFIVPDVTIIQEEEVLKAVINDDRVPSFRLNTRYLRMLEGNELTPEAKEYIQQKVLSGKWLLKSLHQRHDTVLRITEYLIEHQREFFIKSDGQLTPLTMKRVADALEIHESTVARAVASKYVACDRGVIALRSFFTNAYTTEDGESISSNTVKDKVKELIDEENKNKPLSDDEISTLISKSGIKCARRTVAKYRKELNLGNAAQRRLYS